MAGPVAGGFIVARADFNGLFIASGLIGAAVLLLSLVLREPAEPAELEDDDDFNLRNSSHPFRTRSCCRGMRSSSLTCFSSASSLALCLFISTKSDTTHLRPA